MQNLDAQQSGVKAEYQASVFLQRQGLTLLAKNYACRGGELDLVMQDRDTLVFVEVRLRSHARFGDALESIDWRKQQRLRLAAEHYLAEHNWSGPCRFDAVGIVGSVQLHWVQNAFEG